jgi:hypothetical protein
LTLEIKCNQTRYTNVKQESPYLENRNLLHTDRQDQRGHPFLYARIHDANRVGRDYDVQQRDFLTYHDAKDRGQIAEIHPLSLKIRVR